ncbi:MAG: Uma2 family endonuclease [Thermoanaerobaculia bacterium]
MSRMMGGSRAHNLVITNIVRELSFHLKNRSGEVYAYGQRVRIPETGIYIYPDVVVVVCGEPRFEDEHLDTLLNPVLIVEVLSLMTEAYDRGKKFQHYQQINSLAEYVLVSQDQPRIERFVRQDGTSGCSPPPKGWSRRSPWPRSSARWIWQRSTTR